MRLRERKKQESRARVLEAARVLFEDEGFEETTIRSIAREAGVSLGGVFTTFTGKNDILIEIVAERRAALIERIKREAHGFGETAFERLHGICCLGHRESFPNRKLGLAFLGAAFSWSDEAEKANSIHQARMAEVLAEVLREGMEKGEIRRDLDLYLFLKMLVGLTIANFRLAHYGDWTVEEMDDVLRRQFELLFDGVRPREEMSGAA